jgi:orotate phosphoribosyltransferase
MSDHAQKDALLRMLRASGAVRFGEFTLASGQTSDVYVDVKLAWTDPDNLAILAEGLAARVGPTDRLAGMELGAVPLVVATALQTHRPYSVIRKSAKDHGTRKRIEGEIPARSNVLLIEDVSTTGGTMVESVHLLRDAGALVTRALVIIDRGAGAIDRLHEVGVSLEPLATLAELRETRS